MADQVLRLNSAKVAFTPGFYAFSFCGARSLETVNVRNKKKVWVEDIQQLHWKPPEDLNTPSSTSIHQM